MNRLHPLAVLLSLVLVAGCATGPDFGAVSASIPAVAPDKGRVYFYRDVNPFGIAVQPTIYIRGQPVGPCVPGGVYFFDLPPGKYEAAVATEVTRRLSFVLERGEEKYIRCYLTAGIFEPRPHLELVGAEKARTAIRGLSFVGGGTAR